MLNDNSKWYDATFNSDRLVIDQDEMNFNFDLALDDIDIALDGDFGELSYQDIYSLLSEEHDRESSNNDIFSVEQYGDTNHVGIEVNNGDFLSKGTASSISLEKVNVIGEPQRFYDTRTIKIRQSWQNEKLSQNPARKESEADKCANFTVTTSKQLFCNVASSNSPNDDRPFILRGSDAVARKWQLRYNNKQVQTKQIIQTSLSKASNKTTQIQEQCKQKENAETGKLILCFAEAAVQWCAPENSLVDIGGTVSFQ